MTKAREIFHELKNTLNLLTLNKLTIAQNDPLFQASGSQATVTWPNHVAGRINSENHFGHIAQFRHFLETGAFHCLLTDGSIIRGSYTFEGDRLIKHSLLWHPSPFPLEPEDLTAWGGPLDLIDLYMTGRDWHQHIRMRSPLRFDFDPSIESSEHPASHLHLQTNSCRLFVDRPVCFERFIKFVFKNFYPELYSGNSYLTGLKETSLGNELLVKANDGEAYVGWVPQQ